MPQIKYLRSATVYLKGRTASVTFLKGDASTSTEDYDTKVLAGLKVDRFVTEVAEEVKPVAVAAPTKTPDASTATPVEAPVAAPAAVSAKGTPIPPKHHKAASTKTPKAPKVARAEPEAAPVEDLGPGIRDASPNTSEPIFNNVASEEKIHFEPASATEIDSDAQLARLTGNDVADKPEPDTLV